MQQAIYSLTHRYLIVCGIATVLAGCSPQKDTTPSAPTTGSTRILEVSSPTPEPSITKPELTGERFLLGRLNLKPGDRLEQEVTETIRIGGKADGKSRKEGWVEARLSMSGFKEAVWETEILAVSEGEVTELSDRITRGRKRFSYEANGNNGKSLSDDKTERLPLEGKTIHHRKAIRNWKVSIEGMSEEDTIAFESRMSQRTMDPFLGGFFPKESISIGYSWKLTPEQLDGMVYNIPSDPDDSEVHWAAVNEATATATFQEITDYQGERCALVMVHFSIDAKKVSEDYNLQVKGQNALYVSLDSGLILKQVMEGPVQVNGASDAPEMESAMTGMLKYERYMRKQTSRPTERTSDQ